MDYIDRSGIDTSYERKVFEYRPEIKNGDVPLQDRGSVDTKYGEATNQYEDIASIITAIGAVNTQITLGAIDDAQSALDYVLDDISEGDFPNTSNAISHAKEFWDAIGDYCEGRKIGDEQIAELVKIIEEIKGIELGIEDIYSDIPLAYIDGSVTQGIPDDTSEALRKYLELHDLLKAKELELEQKKARYCSYADFNHIVYNYAKEALDIGSNIAGVASTEKTLLADNLDTIINKNSKEMLEKSANYIYNGIVSDIGVLNRIYNAHLNIENVKAHLEFLDKYSIMKEAVIPASKLLFREKSESGCVDIVGIIMNDICDECKSIESKYDEYMSSVVRLAASENNMLAKTFHSELKQQRFKYIKDNI